MRPGLGGRIEPAAVPPPAEFDPADGLAEPAPSPYQARQASPPGQSEPGPAEARFNAEQAFPRPDSTWLDSRGVLIFAVALLLAALGGLAFVVAG